MSSLFEFEWTVSQAGYTCQRRDVVPLSIEDAEDRLEIDFTGDSSEPDQIRSYKSREEWLLERRRADGAERRYRPLSDETGLFLMFAQLEPTQAGILSFATQYGLLGGRAEIRVAGTEQVGELLHVWVEEIKAMRGVVGLWDAVRAGRPNAVSTVLERGDPLSASNVAGNRYRSGERIEAAKVLIAETITDRLQGLVSPAVLHQEGEVAFRVMPSSLLGALWLQCGLGVTGNREFRECRRAKCGKWFELSPDAYRTHRQFCSDPCRFRAYRQRQAEAMRLKGAGVPVREIAQRLDSDVKTVRGWVQEVSRPTGKRHPRKQN